MVVGTSDADIYVANVTVLYVQPHIFDVLCRGNGAVCREIGECYRRTVRTSHYAAWLSVGQEGLAGLTNGGYRLEDADVVLLVMAKCQYMMGACTYVVGQVYASDSLRM